MINNVVLASGVQQSDSVIHINVSILFRILFPFRLLQNTEQHSLCYTVGPCWLSILNRAVCISYNLAYMQNLKKPKMIQMNLLTKQKQTLRFRERTYGYQYSALLCRAVSLTITTSPLTEPTHHPAWCPPK